MTCPKCQKPNHAELEGIIREDGDPVVYVVVCSGCGAPLHFFETESNQHSIRNLYNVFDEIKSALNGVAEAIASKK